MRQRRTFSAARTRDPALADVVDALTRSRMMAGIHSRNTRPEKLVRSSLHKRGFRFRLQSKKVPGRPDLILPRYRAAVFVHGCFWHGHDCSLFRLPSTRTAFWRQKIGRNRDRDVEVRALVTGSGWRHLAIWECAVRGIREPDLERVAERVARWVCGQRKTGDIRGRPRA